MMGIDTIEGFCGSKIQHGKYNDRIYLMKIRADSESDNLPEKMIDKAKKHAYSKIFAKVAKYKAKAFLRAGFVKEAHIPDFYKSATDALFLGYYLDDKRSFETDGKLFDNIVTLAETRANPRLKPLVETPFNLRHCNKEDAENMSEIYKAVFPSYPFPIHDPDYIKKTMQENVSYFGVEVNGGLVSLASAEMDMDALNVEMTDFATLPQWRGNSFSAYLLEKMEEEVVKRGITTAYTIARAASLGVNFTFARLKYSFAGRLKNNTNISGKIESMNVWYKKLC